VHQLVIEGVGTIVYAIIVCTYTAFKSSAWPFLSRSKKIARAHIKFYTNTSYFTMLNQIANLQICDLLIFGSEVDGVRTPTGQLTTHQSLVEILRAGMLQAIIVRDHPKICYAS